MRVEIYVIVEPGGDRPYFSHSPPTGYQKKSGAKVYLVVTDLPDLFEVDARCGATAKEVTESE